MKKIQKYVIYIGIATALQLSLSTSFSHIRPNDIIHAETITRINTKKNITKNENANKKNVTTIHTSKNKIQDLLKDPKAKVLTWGDSTWVLSNSGELIFVEGNIGTPKRLWEILQQNNIDTSLIKSIEITSPTIASERTGLFSELPELKTIIGMRYLNYSGTADSMFHNDTNLEYIDFDGFDSSRINNMGYMFRNTGLKELNLSSFDSSNVYNMYCTFQNTNQLKKLNLSNFNTSNVENMSFAFAGCGAIELDLSSFDTPKVTNMFGIFDGNQHLEKLDLSSFTITPNTNVDAFFGNDFALKELKLGKKSQIRPNMALPKVPTKNGFTGHWQNVGTGTVEKPNGKSVWTSDELLANYDAPTMGPETFVWQKESSKMNTGTSTNYSKDTSFSSLVASATTPIHPYRYNVVLNNDYPYYTKIEDNQSEASNVVNLDDKIGATVYNKQQMTVTYNGGDKDGKQTTFVQVSFDGNKWYWVDEHALNLDLKSEYPPVNNAGVKLLDDVFLGSTITYGDFNMGSKVNSQMVSNAYNADGKIIYRSTAKESDFSSEEDPSKALKVFNDNLDRAAKSWNDAIDKDNPIFIKAKENEKVTLEVSVSPVGQGSATLNGYTNIDIELIKYAMDPTTDAFPVNAFFTTTRHELGHSLGLNHTKNGQYYGMPDGYSFSIDDDAMNAVLTYESHTGYSWTQKTITQNSIDAVKLILKNHNFENPSRQPNSSKEVNHKGHQKLTLKYDKIKNNNHVK